MNASAKATAQKIAKQIAQEPLEILKTAKEQVTGEEISETLEKPTSQQEEIKPDDENSKLKQEVQSQRLLSALDRELKDITREKLFKDLQQKIGNGEEVYLEDQDELSIEQKQVLKAQIEAMEKQKEYSQQVEAKPSLFGSSKPSRRFGAGQKQTAEKQTTRVEKPVPPSG